MSLVLDPASKKLVELGLIGLVIAGALLTGIELRPSTIFPNEGTLLLQITDAPSEVGSGNVCHDCAVTSLNVTVDSIMVHREGALNLTGGWIEGLHGPKTFDLSRLRGTTQILASASLPQGTINLIRLHVTVAVANLSLTRQIVMLDLPSDKLDVPLGSVTVKGGLTTTVILDFPHTIDCGVDGRCILTPPVVHVKSVIGPK